MAAIFILALMFLIAATVSFVIVCMILLARIWYACKVLDQDIKKDL